MPVGDGAIITEWHDKSHANNAARLHGSAVLEKTSDQSPPLMRMTTEASYYQPQHPITLGDSWTIAATVHTPVRTSTTWNTLLQDSPNHHHLFAVPASSGHLGMFHNATFYDTGFVFTSLTPGMHSIMAIGNNNNTDMFVDSLHVGTIALQPQTDIHRHWQYYFW